MPIAAHSAGSRQLSSSHVDRGGLASDDGAVRCRPLSRGRGSGTQTGHMPGRTGRPSQLQYHHRCRKMAQQTPVRNKDVAEQHGEEAHGVKERCRVGHTERPSREELQVQHRFEVVGRLVQQGAAKRCPLRGRRGPARRPYVPACSVSSRCPLRGRRGPARRPYVPACSVSSVTGGQEHTRLRSPAAASTRPTGGHHLVARKPGTG